MCVAVVRIVFWVSYVSYEEAILLTRGRLVIQPGCPSVLFGTHFTFISAYACIHVWMECTSNNTHTNTSDQAVLIYWFRLFVEIVKHYRYFIVLAFNWVKWHWNEGQNSTVSRNTSRNYRPVPFTTRALYFIDYVWQSFFFLANKGETRQLILF